MKQTLKIFALAALLLLVCPAAFAASKNIQLMSPDGHIVANITAGKTLSWAVYYDGECLLQDSRVEMKLTDGTVYGGGKLQKFSRRSADETFAAIAYKRAEVHDHYNELTLCYKNCDVIFRAYDDCIAYRFVSKSKKPFKVQSETAEFNFAEDWNTWVAFSWNGFESSFENIYEYYPLSQIHPEKLAYLPQMIDAPKGRKINIMESALYKYPGMYLQGNGTKNLHGVWAPLPKEMKQGGYNNIQEEILSRHDYLAECLPGEKFPWRIFAISTSDIQMVNNDIVYRLGDAPAKGSDFSWVKPGKVAWDWWNNFYVTGVDFKVGINNDTYKHYIDFAAENGIEYIIMDDGWSTEGKADLFDIVPAIDLEMLTSYAAEKGVGIILWAGYYAFARDMEHVCKHYSAMGVKGFKIDFMNRDDQYMLEFYTKAAQVAAKYHLVLDFHGAFKPHGLNRTYPNVLNYEGVYGLENMRWTGIEIDMPLNDVTFPYIRMAAGVVDYTQGAMRNGSRSTYLKSRETMSQGTRCHQLGEYVIFESPLCMLCDGPSAYRREPECLSFISRIPTVFDDSVGLGGEVGKYILMARRSGDTWYVGGTTNWDERDVTLDLSFLGSGKWQAEIYRDGMNADRHATDFKHEFKTVAAGDKLDIHMAPGGGFAIVLTK
ncbi:MAG: glycoside hydrolase family 97 protein [Bacteroidales bacterium]|nr:glycoside hydrolase family 97 protein [Bacteroidales bacterium]